MPVPVDRQKCTALGMCEVEALGVFEVQDDGSLMVLKACRAADDLATAQATIEACPTEAAVGSAVGVRSSYQPR